MTPMTREINPRLVFERLFASELPRNTTRRPPPRLYKKSILDFVLEDAKSCGKVGGRDREKLDQYFTAIREIEQRVENAEKMVASAKTNRGGGLRNARRDPESYEHHAKLMCDMLVLAFQADVTRVGTFMLANEGSNRSYRNIGVSDGHHTLSHHQGDHAKQMKIREINRFHIQQLAYMLDRLKAIPEGEGSLLDNCMIVYGGGLRTGIGTNISIFLVMAGRGGGTLTPGRHLALPARNADVQSARLDARARRRARQRVRRQHRRIARAGCVEPSRPILGSAMSLAVFSSAPAARAWRMTPRPRRAEAHPAVFVLG